MRVFVTAWHKRFTVSTMNKVTSGFQRLLSPLLMQKAQVKCSAFQRWIWKTYRVLTQVKWITTKTSLVKKPS
ncbi:Uncharacterised protein [Vibrio cholerae]|nr:Uncharacterised protein [Vibrio cholerae]